MLEVALILMAITAIGWAWSGYTKSLTRGNVMEESWLAPDDPRLIYNQKLGGQDDADQE